MHLDDVFNASRSLKCISISFHYSWFYLWYEWCLHHSKLTIWLPVVCRQIPNQKRHCVKHFLGDGYLQAWKFLISGKQFVPRPVKVFLYNSVEIADCNFGTQHETFHRCLYVLSLVTTICVSTSVCVLFYVSVLLKKRMHSATPTSIIFIILWRNSKLGYISFEHMYFRHVPSTYCFWRRQLLFCWH